MLPGLVRSDDLQKHRAPQRGEDSSGFDRAQPSDEVADAMVQSLLTNRAEAAVGFVSWWVWFGGRMFSGAAVRFFMQREVWKHARREKADN